MADGVLERTASVELEAPPPAAPVVVAVAVVRLEMEATVDRLTWVELEAPSPETPAVTAAVMALEIDDAVEVATS